MEEFDNETNNNESKRTIIIKPLAFQEIKIENKKHDDKNTSENNISNSDKLSYNDSDFFLARENTIKIRDNNPVNLLTSKIISLYKKCQNDYNFEEIEKPKRELTIPIEGVYNDSYDNIDHDLIVCMDDVIKGPEYEYLIIDILGQGISGQVFKCKRLTDNRFFAMKIIKNKKAHHCQALIELRILEFLNNKVDIHDCYHIIRKYDHFYFKNHLCIIFELLNENLFELLKQNYFQGLSLNSIRFILKQILQALLQLQKSDLIHCDLKPENILLKIDKDSKNEILIKVTDFGSACFKDNTFFQYIQSRYYRAPETIIGYPYSVEIDMWSLGCIAAELFLGEPLFPGSSEFDQLFKIVNFIIEDMPYYMLKNGRNTKKYYNVINERDENGKFYNVFKLKTIEEYFKENPNVTEPKYSIPNNLTNLDDILKMQTKKNLNQSNTSISDINNQSQNHHYNDLESFVHFLKGLLTVDPKKRWNAKTALRHPFILKEKFDGNFNIEQNDEISLFIINQSVDNNLNFNHNKNTNFNKFPNCKNSFPNGHNQNFNYLKNGYNNQISNNQCQMNQNNPNFLPNCIQNQTNNRNKNYTNNKNCFSMMMNSGVDSVDSSSYNSVNSFNNQYMNSSTEYSCYQPNICNIPLNMLKNFPYGRIDNIDLKAQDKNMVRINSQVKNNQNVNQTFTMENFNKLGNNSYTNDGSFYGNYNINLNYVNNPPNSNIIMKNFTNLNLNPNLAYNNQFLNISSEKFNKKGSFHNLNNSFNNIQDENKNNSRFIPKNLGATPSKFNHNNLNNSIINHQNNNSNLNTSHTSNVNKNPNNNANNYNQKTSLEHNQGNLSYFKTENDNSSSIKDYEDLQSHDGQSNKGSSTNVFRARSYSDYYENNNGNNKNLNKNTYMNTINKNSNYGGGYGFYKNNLNNNSYHNKQNNSYHSQSYKFKKNSKNKNMSSQNTPIINNKNIYHQDEMSNKSEIFLSTDEIKEELDEEFNNINAAKQSD